MRPEFVWRLRSRTLELGRRTLVMGILNVTPDSFSDGGRFLDHAHAVAQALKMLAEGADIIDIGGESTRPGAAVEDDAAVSLTAARSTTPAAVAGISPQPTQPRRLPGAPLAAVSAREELDRVLPVIAEIRRQAPDAVLSIDTYKAAVARATVEAGVEIVNDVSALRGDADMAGTVAALGCGVVLMHMRGRPDEWRTLPRLGLEVVGLVCRELGEWAGDAMAAGVERERLMLDPGFGFGKNFEENYPLLAHFDEFERLGFPLLAATSRKSFIARTVSRTGEPAPANRRLYGTLATVTAAILRGAHIVRVHDVEAAREAAAVADEILRAS